MNITILCMDITMFYRYKSSMNRQFSRAMMFYCRGPRSFSEGGGAKMEEWLSNPMITGESCRSFPPFFQVSKYHVSKIQSNAQKKRSMAPKHPETPGGRWGICLFGPISMHPSQVLIITPNKGTKNQ